MAQRSARPDRHEPAPYLLVDLDADHVKGVAFNMVFLVWRFETRVDAFRKAMRLTQELGTKFPEGIGVCQVVEAEAIAPTLEARKLFMQMWREIPMKHHSVTHEGTGFKAASVRAIVATAHAFARAGAEHAVHKKMEEAAEWHARQQARIGRKETAAEILQVANGLRELHRQRYKGSDREG